MSPPVDSGPITAAEIAELADHDFLAGGEHHRELDSTNALAIARLAEQPLLPYLIYAERQTAGRGRGNNRWLSSEGSLTFSLITAPAINVPTDRLASLALTVAVACAEACSCFVPTESIRTKWPNDLFVCGRKAGGILIERPAEAQSLVIGIGLNVNNQCEKLSGLKESPATLAAAADRPIDRKHLLSALLECFAARWDAWLTQPAAPSDWHHWCLLTGREITLRAGGIERSGRCIGIDTSGSLLLEENGKQLSIPSAEAIRLAAIKP